MKLFILNCGSSSIKFQLVDMPQNNILSKGSIARVGKEDAEFKYKIIGKDEVFEIISVKDHNIGIEIILTTLFDSENKICNIEDVSGIGHRIVQGGDKCKDSIIVTQDVIDYIDSISELAPLHNPAHLAGIRACQDKFRNIPQVVVFDNGLHNTLPQHVYLYALPYEYYKKYKIRKYGFHGIAFRSMMKSVEQILNSNHTKYRIISLMLGSGTTANAMKYGESVEVSTGFTPLEGLVQSTRSGDVDVAALTYLMRKENLSSSEVDFILNNKSGWYGLSQISNDLREIYEESLKGNDLAKTTIKAITHRFKKYVGAYSAIMGGVDILIFSGGVGENAWYIRENVCKDMEFLGVEIDKEKNKQLKDEGIISTEDSKVKIVVVKANEEKIIAEDTYNLIENLK